MCGIIGYSGNMEAARVILDSLVSLEYRGYDSCGVCLVDENNKIHTIKTTGKVSNLAPLVKKLDGISTHIGIGHTRWATHGGVTFENAHPHNAGMVNLIHNGIIENYDKLKAQYGLFNVLTGETDSEIVANVLNILYQKNNNDPFIAIKNLTKIISGTYSFLIIFEDKPGIVFALKHVSPLICGNSENGSFIASDLTALIPYLKEFSVVEENTIIEADKNSLKAYDIDTLKEKSIKKNTITWEKEMAMKNGFEHFMLKEIHEQPDVLEKTIISKLDSSGNISFENDKFDDIVKDIFRNIDKIQIVGCGTALNAGRVGAEVFQGVINIPIDCYIASEYRYCNTLINNKTLVIAISQSGETVDTLACLEKAHDNKAKVISIVNVKESSIARESDYVIYTHAGPEIAVASTKAYTVQVATLYLLLTYVTKVRGIIDEMFEKKMISSLKCSIENINKVLQNENEIKAVVKSISNSRDAFYIGRGLDYCFSIEGALKLKEISYIHTEAYAAGELKHGTIALIEKGTPVIAVCTQKSIARKSLSNVKEVKARGAYVVLVVSKGIDYDCSTVDKIIEIDNVDDRFSVFPIAVVTQMIAYYTAYIKGLDIDKPRNLAKSVTVE